MKTRVVVEVKHVSMGFYSVQVGGVRLHSPGGEYHWDVEELARAGLRIPPRPTTVEVALTADEADVVVEAWGTVAPNPNSPLFRAVCKFADAVKKARS